MNLQQLNDNVKSLQDFIGTSFVVLVKTGDSWFFTKQINGYRYWYSKRGGKKQAATSETIVGERIPMIVWLLQHSKHFWLWKLSTWWRVPFSDDTKIIRKPEFGVGGPSMLLSVTDYVSRYI